MKRLIIPGTIPTKDLHQYLLGAVAPRPIAFVSSKDEEGRTNLAPYSFFNAFSSNPPILVFSSNRRVVDNTTKDTLANIQKTKECVVNVVNYAIVRQMMVSSVDFPHEISEFDQTGLTAENSIHVGAPLVQESPVNMECRVTDIITLGHKGGAGHLIICEVVCMHILESILDENNRIDPHKIDLMGRMGRAYYVRASGSAVLTLPQSQAFPVTGYPGLPDHVKESKILTANAIGALCGMNSLPGKEEAINAIRNDTDLSEYLGKSLMELHAKAQELIEDHQLEKAANLLVTY